MLRINMLGNLANRIGYDIEIDGNYENGPAFDVYGQYTGSEYLGLSYPDMLEVLLEMAVTKYGEEKSLHHSWLDDVELDEDILDAIANASLALQ